MYACSIVTPGNCGGVLVRDTSTIGSLAVLANGHRREQVVRLPAHLDPGGDLVQRHARRRARARAARRSAPCRPWAGRTARARRRSPGRSSRATCPLRSTIGPRGACTRTVRNEFACAWPTYFVPASTCSAQSRRKSAPKTTSSDAAEDRDAQREPRRQPVRLDDARARRQEPRDRERAGGASQGAAPRSRDPTRSNGRSSRRTSAYTGAVRIRLSTIAGTRPSSIAPAGARLAEHEVHEQQRRTSRGS